MNNSSRTVSASSSESSNSSSSKSPSSTRVGPDVFARLVLRADDEREKDDLSIGAK